MTILEKLTYKNMALKAKKQPFLYFGLPFIIFVVIGQAGLSTMMGGYYDVRKERDSTAHLLGQESDARKNKDFTATARKEPGLKMIDEQTAAKAALLAQSRRPLDLEQVAKEVSEKDKDNYEMIPIKRSWEPGSSHGQKKS